MGNRGYDFRIKQSSYEEALEVYRMMLDTLDEERTILLTNIDSWDESWDSERAVQIREAAKIFLTEGRYEEAYHHIKEMHKLMEETVPEIRRALKISETFDLQLSSDSYVHSADSGKETDINGGVLAINYGNAQAVIDKCDDIVEQVNSLERDMREIMMSCLGLMDGVTEYNQQLSLAAAKVRRVENYKRAVQLYMGTIRMIEEEIHIKLRGLLAATDSATTTEAFRPAGLHRMGTFPAKVRQIVSDPYRGVRIAKWLGTAEGYGYDISTNPSVVEHLQRYGYTDEEITAVANAVRSESDRMFAVHFFSGNPDNYEAAFAVNPEELSPEMKECLIHHFLKAELMDGTSDGLLEADGLEETENLINALLMAKPDDCRRVSTYYHDEYIELISGKMHEKSASTVFCLDTALKTDLLGEEEIQALILESKGYFNQYSLWQSLDQINQCHYRIGAEPSSLFNGEMMLQISNLKGGQGANPDGHGAYRYDVTLLNSTTGENVWDTEGGEYIGAIYKVELTYPDHLRILDDGVDSELEQRMREQEEWMSDLAGDLFLQAVGMWPFGGNMTESILKKVMQNPDNGITGMCREANFADLLTEKDKAALGNEAVETLCILVQAWSDYQGRAGEIDALLEKKQIYNFGTYVRMDMSLIAGDRNSTLDYLGCWYVASQRESPQIVYKYHLLDEEGIDAYLNSMICEGMLEEKEIDGLKGEMWEDFSHRPDIRAFIEGDMENLPRIIAENPVKKEKVVIRPQEQMADIINEVNAYINNQHNGILSINDWMSATQ